MKSALLSSDESKSAINYRLQIPASAGSQTNFKKKCPQPLNMTRRRMEAYALARVHACEKKTDDWDFRFESRSTNWCCWFDTAVQAQVADSSASSDQSSSSFPGTVIGLSAALAVTATILIAVVIGFIVYVVRRGRDSSVTDRDPIVASGSGGPRHMSHVVASGFDSVRSKFSVASDDSDVSATPGRDQ